MSEALALAAGALGTTSPNPAVGAVIVRDGRVVGRGRTQPPGGPHAEVVALREAGEAARGATAYVTLEPCAHHGRTPPCADALIEAGIAAVHYAVLDPDSNVAGAGDARLRAAGVQVERGDGAPEAERLMEGYLHHRRTGRPFVIVKVASSLDGRIAASSGDARWVSGPEARAWVHRLRAQVDAIAVGAGTLLADDPELTARPDGMADPHQPLRVVLDSHARTPPTARVLAGGGALIAATAAAPGERVEALRAAGAEVLVLPADADEQVDVDALLDALGARDVLTLLVEGGGTLLGTLFDRRNVGRLYAVIAPVIIGAASAPSAVAGVGAAKMADAPRLHDLAVERLGEDTLISGRPSWDSAGGDGTA
jgi:diaminohydroxyphosphoribosylaminopyrimidine deaminase/5-amino-6-(5-phosphoribosylamino)uracil reductase